MEESNIYLSLDVPPIPPIAPPIISSYDYPICPDFTFISDTSTRQIIESAYKVVARTNSWQIIRNFHSRSFLFSGDHQIVELMTKINDEYNGHSGTSLSCTMRNINYIAKNGFNSYREYFIDNNRVQQRRQQNLPQVQYNNPIHLPQ